MQIGLQELILLARIAVNCFQDEEAGEMENYIQFVARRSNVKLRATCVQGREIKFFFQLWQKRNEKLC